MGLSKWVGVSLVVGCLGFGLGAGLTWGVRDALDSAKQSDMDGGLLTPAWAQAAPFVPAPMLTSAAPGASARRTVVVDVAQQVSPAVVTVGAVKTTLVEEADPYGFEMLFPRWRLAWRKFPYLGSGFIIDKEGHVLTNAHVVQDAKSRTVTLTNGREYAARLLDMDTALDVALLKLEDLEPDVDLPIMPLGNSDDIMIGETVMAIGNPFGPLIADPRPSVSVGVVSAVDRSFKPGVDGTSQHIYRNMIQTDAAINPGNSGGPLVNLDGEAVGMNTFILSKSGDSASIGFSLPINRAIKVVEEILQYGRVRALWKDFEAWTVTPGVANWLDLKVDSGALVKSIRVDGPADRAGMEPGDVIVAADGQHVATAEDLTAAVVSSNVGDMIELTVVRQGERFNVQYEVLEAPGEGPTRTTAP